jgi:gamma-glutamyltranspeptidase
LKGEGKKLNPINYEPFTILEKRGANAFRLDIPPYMNIYLVVDVENLKYFDPPMIMDQDDEVSIPPVDEFSPEYLDELKEDINLDRRTRTSHRGDVDYL